MKITPLHWKERCIAYVEEPYGYQIHVAGLPHIRDINTLERLINELEVLKAVLVVDAWKDSLRQKSGV